MPDKPADGTINLGALIKKHLEESGMPKTKFAKKIEVNISHLYKIFDNKSLNTDRLIQISTALGYNFLWELMRDSRLKRLKQPVNLTAYNDEALEQVMREPEAVYGNLKRELEETKNKLLKAYETIEELRKQVGKQ